MQLDAAVSYAFWLVLIASSEQYCIVAELSFMHCGKVGMVVGHILNNKNAE